MDPNAKPSNVARPYVVYISHQDDLEKGLLRQVELGVLEDGYNRWNGFSY